MRHAIFTLCDANCGDFLVDHWLKSLQENVDLSNIDIIVLDYGLTDEQRTAIESKGVVCRPCVRDALLNNLVYRDIAATLQEHDYDQVVLIDSGDVIFQADFSDVFERDKDQFRGACEEVDTSIHDVFMGRGDFTDENWKELSTFVRGKPTVNGSSLFAPARKYIALWDVFEKWCKSFDVFCTNQILVNYTIYKEGFVELDPKYNFVLVAKKFDYTIRDGVFYDKHGEIIPIVHNAGGKDRYRFFKNFGYGPEYNQRKWIAPYALRCLFWFVARAKRLTWRSKKDQRSRKGTTA